MRLDTFPLIWFGVENRNWCWNESKPTNRANCWSKTRKSHLQLKNYFRKQIKLQIVEHFAIHTEGVILNIWLKALKANMEFVKVQFLNIIQVKWLKRAEESKEETSNHCVNLLQFSIRLSSFEMAFMTVVKKAESRARNDCDPINFFLLLSWSWHFLCASLLIVLFQKEMSMTFRH